MKYLAIAWTVIINIVVLIIAFAVLGTAETTFQKVVISLLGLIFVNINSYFGFYGRFGLQNMLVSNTQLVSIRESLSSDNLIHADKQSLDVIEQQLLDSKIKYWINMGFSYILYLVIAFNLITSL